ncbi:hypothetical protein M8C21_021310, partial [Ambrosia artemisiifolia]
MKDGWGLATDGKILFGTDGSSSLYHLHPRTMKVIKKHVMKYKGHESDCIARISPADGSVIGWVLLPELRAELLSVGNRVSIHIHELIIASCYYWK